MTAKVTAQEALEAGVAAHRSGDFSNAHELYAYALSQQPQHPDALHLLGVIAFQTGDPEQAVKLISQAISITPSMPTFHNNLGNALRAQERLPEAIAAFRTAVTLHPTYPDALANLGHALRDSHDLEAARQAYTRALELDPGAQDALIGLGTLLRTEGRLSDAIATYEQALQLAPGSPHLLNNLGVAYHERGDFGAALSSYQRAIELQPSYAEAFYNLGSTLHAQGLLTEAVASYQRVIELVPEYAEAYNNLGTVLHELGDRSGAIASYRRALQHQAAFVDAHFNLALALQDAGDLPAAADSYEQALRFRQNHAEACGKAVHLRQQLCDWSRLAPLIPEAKRLLHILTPNPISPFVFLALDDAPLEQRVCAETWAAAKYTHTEATRPELKFSFPRQTKPKLHIGYLSADFRNHPVGYLIAELFELHDRGQFTVSAYSIGSADTSGVRERILRATDNFVDLEPLTPTEAATHIHNDEVDILIDLMGYTKGNRTEILALRPAPVQVNYLGYPGTMGARFMDYIVTDRFLTPPDQQPFYSERFAYLPDTYQINDRLRPIADKTPSRAECGLPEEGFIFCSFSNTYKITPEIFALWMRLMHQTPESVLWLLESNVWAPSNLHRHAHEHGVNPDRLIFAPMKPLAEHLARYRLADLFLDTTPYGAHTTASDALWAGLPVLTYAGRGFASRVAGSLLSAIGLPELITYSLHDYEALALRLAHAPSEITALKEKVARHRETEALFDSPRYTRHLEQLYLSFWNAHVGR